MIFSKPRITAGLLSVVIGFSTTPAPAAAGPIYVVRRPDGSVTFTTRSPSRARGKVSVYSGKNAAFSRTSKRRRRSYPVRASARSSTYRALIDEVSDIHGVDSALVKAMIHVESSFNPQAVSPKGAIGLMQLMPATAKRFGVQKPFLPVDNITGGVKYLAELLRLFGGNLRYALAAYNAGEGAVKRYGGIPPFAETKQYVTKVLSLVPHYRKRDAEASSAQGKK